VQTIREWVWLPGVEKSDDIRLTVLTDQCSTNAANGQNGCYTTLACSAVRQNYISIHRDTVATTWTLRYHFVDAAKGLNLWLENIPDPK